MGKVLSILIRQQRRIFVQERAERIISKPKPAMHPFYPTEGKIIKQIKAEHPELTEKITEHHPALDDRVGTLRITSKEVSQLDEGGIPKPARPKLESGERKGARLLPQARMTEPEPESGFFEPPEDKVARGRILFSKAMQLLQMRENEREKAHEFAKQFGIAATDTKLILEYFAPFTKYADLADAREQEKEELHEATRELIGHRAILQRHRQISDLERRRMTAKLVMEADSDSQEKIDRLKETGKPNEKT